MMDDQELAALIKEQCSTYDYEVNGCRLDDIMRKHLKDTGYTKAAEAFENVECWRA